MYQISTFIFNITNEKQYTSIIIQCSVRKGNTHECQSSVGLKNEILHNENVYLQKINK